MGTDVVIGPNASKPLELEITLFVSDMGFIAMPQLALSSAFAGSAEPDVLIPSGSGPGGSLEIPVEERRRAARKLEGD